MKTTTTRMKTKPRFDTSKIENPCNINPDSVVYLFRQATLKTNRWAAAIGAVFGAFVPIASYQLVHHEVQGEPMLWILVTGGLIYSATTVFEWAKTAFKHPLKAWGFVILIEGVLAFSQTDWLSCAALALLVTINSVAAGCALATDYKSKPVAPEIQLDEKQARA